MSVNFEGLKRGDRVRIVLETEVTGMWGGDGDKYIDTLDNCFSNEQDDVVSVEKIEPPVEQFGPGDIVRHKSASNVYSVTTSGLYSHETFRHFTETEDWKAKYLTSEYYERVGTVTQ